MTASVYSRTGLGLVVFLVAFLPLARGGIHPWAVTLMQTGILSAACLLMVERVNRRVPLNFADSLYSPILWVLVLCGISALASPYPSGEGLFSALVYAAAYWVVRSSVRSRRDREFIARALVVTAVFLAVFGLFKRYGMNPFMFWQYDELPYGPGTLAATFNNHNHLAGYLEMALPFGVVLVVNRCRSKACTILAAYGVVLILITLVLTLSRGGWLASLCGMTVLGFSLWRRKRISGRTLVGAGGGLALVFFLVLVSSTPVLDRAATWTEKEEAASLESRVIAWQGSLDLIRDHWLTGTGPGTFSQAFTRYQPPGLGLTFRQAHNDYLQAVADVGVLVIPLLIWGGYRMVRNCRNTGAGGPLDPAVLAVLVTLGVHSFFDFNFHVPANAFVFITILGIAARNPESPVPERRAPDFRSTL